MTPPPPPPRRTITWIAGGVFACATAVVFWVVAVSSASSGAASVLIGPLDELSLLTLSALLAFGSLGVGLWSIEAPRRMLPLKVIGVVLATCAGALAALAAVFTVDANVTPVLHRGCDTGYVVVERSFLMGSSGTVYRQDGAFIVTQVGRSSGDNGHQPFSMGGYAVTEERGMLTVSYAVNRPVASTGVTAGSGTSLSLPVLDDRSPQCGLHTARSADQAPYPPIPSPEPEKLTAETVDGVMREMIGASFTAAAGVVVDASGAPLDSSSLPLSSTPCTEGPGTQREVQIAFRTDDNSRSLERILAVWDQAGYAKDRAMQEDIRYSESLPVARVGIKDTSSLDGLIHLTSTSVCIPPA
ncbi:hypothetical protein [Microbacterium oxydans]|uniref:hypothetical protein n=1 Tax=Microbacterium oxydans TaxID=82380 RepID=UPI000F8F98DD|nr:hypothetical protein [Microbacterium oxydans]AZS48508.1 hypothetical protein CVS53_03229 [Microbacterium oxydans]